MSWLTGLCVRSSMFPQKTIPKPDIGKPGEFEIVGWIEEKERHGMMLEASERLLLKIYREKS